MCKIDAVKSAHQGSVHLQICMLLHFIAASMAASMAKLARCSHRSVLQAGVHYIEGKATVVDEHTVSINGKEYTVRHCWSHTHTLIT